MLVVWSPMSRRFLNPAHALWLLAVLLAALLAVPVAAANSGALVYRKVFKGSTPEFTEIRVHADGSATFDIRNLEDEAGPAAFEVSLPVTQKLFELAAQLGHFRGVELDARRRIANLGEKTFRYEGPGGESEVSFNYTVNPAANQLLRLFEGLARQQDHLLILQRRMRFDRLGVHDALLALEADLNRKIIPEPEVLLPTLEQIAAESRFVEIARQRARTLIERIRGGR